MVTANWSVLFLWGPLNHKLSKAVQPYLWCLFQFWPPLHFRTVSPVPVEDFTCKVHSSSKAEPSDVEECLSASIDAARRDPETGIVLLTLNLLFTPLTPCRLIYLHTSVFEKYLEKWGDIETFAEKETYIIDYIWIGVSGRAFCCFWFKIFFHPILNHWCYQLRKTNTAQILKQIYIHRHT